MSKPNPQVKKFASVTVKHDKAQPFGAHFTTRLDGVNNKLVCALSLCWVTGCDDQECSGGGGGGGGGGEPLDP